jgi:hypothetical protein
MRRISSFWVAAFTVVLVVAGSARAQDNSEGAKQPQSAENTAHLQTGPFYHLDFVVKEVDGNKVINSRGYSTSIIKDGHNSIRAGARVPIPSGPSAFQFMDLGANFDCGEAREVEGKLALRVIAELSSIAANDQEGLPKTQPVVRQNKWNADVIVPMGKTTTIFSSDDVSGKNKMQVELTATLIK